MSPCFLNPLATFQTKKNYYQKEFILKLKNLLKTESLNS